MSWSQLTQRERIPPHELVPTYATFEEPALLVGVTLREHASLVGVTLREHASLVVATL